MTFGASIEAAEIVTTYWLSTAISVQWRSTPSIMLATSEDEGDFSCEWMHSEFRSTCH